MPAHWNLPRLGSVLRERGETNEQKQVTQVLSVLKDIGVIRYEDKGNIGNKKSDDIGRYKIVRLDDIVVNCMNVIIGSVGQSRYIGCLSPVYYVLTRRNDADNPRFFAAIFSSKPFQLSLVRIGNGILSHRMRIPMELLKCEPFPVPSLDEQAAIVRFLDWANGRLDRAIRAKRRVIALLNEQKQAIIHRAVTRGLDPSVPFKSSGIPWLGDIPQHWEVKRAKYLYREVNDRSSDGSEELLSVSHLTGVTPRSQKNITMFKAASYAGHKLCRPGDLVVNTMWAWMGALGVSTYTGIISPAYAVYRPRQPENIVGIYIDGLLRSRPYVSNIICHSTGLRASRLRLYPEEFFRLPIIQPPTEEQQRIVESIQGESSELDTTISRLECEIELLREYRTRLVADVVTGKLDVREAAARLPEEIPPDTIENATDLDDEINPTDEEADE
jgi:type I restriction enzyme S subunit